MEQNSCYRCMASDSTAAEVGGPFVITTSMSNTAFRNLNHVKNIYKTNLIAGRQLMAGMKFFIFFNLSQLRWNTYFSN